MPAPAVIPAPRAYINAVAVKGFVVELRVPQVDGPVPPCSQGPATPALDTRERWKQFPRDSTSPQLYSRATYAVWGDARDFYCD